MQDALIVNPECSWIFSLELLSRGKLSS